MNLSELFEMVVVSSIATVGLVECLKNFLKTKKKWIFALIMIPLSVGCYFSCKVLPSWVIGGILTIGFTQLDYQILVQGIQSIVKGITEKVGGKVEKAEIEEK